MSEATVRLYHPSGALCVFPITYDPSLAMQNITAYLAAGFLPTEPERSMMESMNDIGWVLRRSRISEVTGTEVPILECWINHASMINKFMTVYLNTDQQVSEFEALAGIRLDQLPLWTLKKVPDRGESTESDKFIIRLPRPIGLAHKPNPKYDPNPAIPIADRKPKRLFVGWKAISSTNEPQHDDQLEETGEPNSDTRGSSVMPANVDLILVQEVKFTSIKNKKYMNLIDVDGKVYRIPTTKAFADEGYDVRQWVEDGGRLFNPALAVYLEPLGKGEWAVARIGELEF